MSIGEYTKIASNVCINDHDHNYKRTGDSHLLITPVEIGRNVWIGSNVVIAAGSVVKGHVPPHTVYFNKRDEAMLEYVKQGE